MLTGVLAISLIGLIEAMSIAQSLASQSGQRIDSNQEFVGQGLANIAAGFFSGYTGSGSFTRSAVNYEAGGKTPLTEWFSRENIVLVCRSSRRSVRAARAIYAKTNRLVLVLEGGMLAWEDAGLPEVISTPSS